MGAPLLPLFLGLGLVGLLAASQSGTASAAPKPGKPDGENGEGEPLPPGLGQPPGRLDLPPGLPPDALLSYPNPQEFPFRSLVLSRLRGAFAGDGVTPDVQAIVADQAIMAATHGQLGPTVVAPLGKLTMYLSARGYGATAMVMSDRVTELSRPMNQWPAPGGPLTTIQASVPAQVRAQFWRAVVNADVAALEQLAALAPNTALAQSAEAWKKTILQVQAVTAPPAPAPTLPGGLPGGAAFPGLPGSLPGGGAAPGGATPGGSAPPAGSGGGVPGLPGGFPGGLPSGGFPGLPGGFPGFPGGLPGSGAPSLPGGSPGGLPAPKPLPAGAAYNPDGSVRYQVRAGDYGAKIASHFGLTPPNAWVPSLVSANPQVKDWTKVYAGQVLAIPSSWMTGAIPPVTQPMMAPAPAAPKPAPAPGVSTTAQPEFVWIPTPGGGQQAVPANQVPVVSAPPPAAAPAPWPGISEPAGGTLPAQGAPWSLADRQGTLPARASAPALPALPAGGSWVQGPEGPEVRYAVRAGDYGAKIAKHFNLPGGVPELVKANPQVKDWTKVKVGQLLRIPTPLSARAAA